MKTYYSQHSGLIFTYTIKGNSSMVQIRWIELRHPRTVKCWNQCPIQCSATHSSIIYKHSVHILLSMNFQNFKNNNYNKTSAKQYFTLQSSLSLLITTINTFGSIFLGQKINFSPSLPFRNDKWLVSSKCDAASINIS